MCELSTPAALTCMLTALGDARCSVFAVAGAFQRQLRSVHILRLIACRYISLLSDTFFGKHEPSQVWLRFNYNSIQTTASC